MKEKPKIVLASGKMFETDYVSVITEPDRCYIRLSGYSVSEIAIAFSDPFETTQMIYNNDLIVGFTSLLSIVNERDTTLVTLKK